MTSIYLNDQNISRAQNTALWMLQIVTSVIFFMAGFSKITGDASMIASFEQIGLGQWFRYFTGSIEILSGILLLSPYSFLGAALLIPTMVCAILAQLIVFKEGAATPFVLLVIVTIIAYARREWVQEMVGKFRK